MYEESKSSTIRAKVFSPVYSVVRGEISKPDFAGISKQDFAGQKVFLPIDFIRTRISSSVYVSLAKILDSK